MAAPLIGITTSRITNDKGHPMLSVMETYIRSVANTGGIPFLIPLGLSEKQLKEALSRVDGVLFTGGGDINPDIYGGREHREVSLVDDDRDQVELVLIKETMRKRKPLFGICRGLQLLNVAAGGSLYEHILDQHPGAMEHCYYPDWPREYLSHSVQVVPESRLAHCLGVDSLDVNSQHHQGIERLGQGLRPCAYAPDGIVEGIEIPGYPFGLAVQWHPEWLQDIPAMRALFSSFINAAELKHGSVEEMCIE
jgi:putative glutamine amidotransferase